MVKYNVKELCPACGFDDHTLRVCFGSVGDFGDCNKKGQHLHRECCICGASFRRATITDEVTDQIISRDSRPIVGSDCDDSAPKGCGGCRGGCGKPD